MSKVEDSHFKIKADEVRSDTTLEEERGWHKMDVRWLVTNKTQDSKQTVVGRTIMPPGVKSKHAIHRHPGIPGYFELANGGHGITQCQGDFAEREARFGVPGILFERVLQIEHRRAEVAFGALFLSPLNERVFTHEQAARGEQQRQGKRQ